MAAVDYPLMLIADDAFILFLNDRAQGSSYFIEALGLYC